MAKRRSKGPAPGLERITTPEGTVYDVTPDGRARVEKGPRLRGASAPGRLRVPVTPKPRQDRSVEAWAARITKTAQQALAALADPGRVEAILGRSIGGGCHLVASDGVIGICRVGEPPVADAGRPPITMLDRVSLSQWVSVTPEFTAALTRMKAVGGGPLYATTITIDPAAQRVTLETTDEGCVSREWLPLVGEGPGRVVKVNAALLLSLLGVPGRLHFSDGDGDATAIVLFVPDGDPSMRAMLAALKAEATTRPEARPDVPATFETSMYSGRSESGPIGKGRKAAAAAAAAREIAARARSDYDVDTLFETRHWTTLVESTADAIAALPPVERRCLHEAWYAHQRRRNWPKAAQYAELSTRLERADDLARVAEHQALAVSDVIDVTARLDQSCSFASTESGEQRLAPPLAHAGRLWVYSDVNDQMARAEGRRYLSALVPLAEWTAAGHPVPTETAQDRYRAFAASSFQAKREAGNDPAAIYDAMRTAWRADHLRGDYSLTRVTYRGAEYVVGPRIRMRVSVVADAAPATVRSRKARAVSVTAPPSAPKAATASTTSDAGGPPSGEALTPAQKAARTRQARRLAGAPSGPTRAPQAATPGTTLTPAQKAAQTRRARLASGAVKPVDWAAAGRKAWETRQRNLKSHAA